MTPRFAVPDTKRGEIEHNFVHHPPSSPAIGECYAAIRAKLKESALFICEQTPPSREQSLALTKLEEAMFWANAAVARNDKPSTMVPAPGLDLTPPTVTRPIG